MGKSAATRARLQKEALRLFATGLVNLSGSHLRCESGGYSNGPAADRLRRQGAEVVGFCSWREGLVLRPGGIWSVGARLPL